MKLFEIDPIYNTKNWKLYYLNNLYEEQEIKGIKKSNLEYINKLKSHIKNKKLFQNNKLISKCDNVDNLYYMYPKYVIDSYQTNIASLLEITKLWDRKYCKLFFNNYIKHDSRFISIVQKYDAVVFVPSYINRQCNILTLLKTYLRKHNINIIHSFKKWLWKDSFDIWKIWTNIKSILIIDDSINTWTSICSFSKKIITKNTNIKIDTLTIIWIE